METCDLPVIDTPATRGLLEVQAGGEIEIFNELVDLVEEESRDLLDELRMAIDTPNRNVVERCAHTLKGHGATFGLPRMQAAAMALEQAARADETTTFPEHLASLEPAVTEALEALRAFRSRL